MARYAYRLVNVFSIDDDPFSGNPLCVFENAEGLSDARMQALALQFNLSETSFLFPSAAADARVRIFTPMYEMPFAGHPTLGSAHVIHVLRGGASAQLRLELNVGVVRVSADGERRYTLQAQAPKTRAVEAKPVELAAMLGLDPRELAGQALWVDTGVEQLIVPLASCDAVARCRPEAAALERHGRVREDRYLVYVFAPNGGEDVQARFFFKKGSAVVEDPATGSACANLGGFLLARDVKPPLRRRVSQGAAAGRPSQLELHVDVEHRIFVAGHVRELGSGVVDLAE